MNWIVCGLLAVICMLILVVLVRTILFTPEEMPPANKEYILLNDEKCFLPDPYIPKQRRIEQIFGKL